MNDSSKVQECIATLFVLCGLLVSCAGSGPTPSSPQTPAPPPPPSVSSVVVSPSTATLEVEQSQQFTVTVEGTGNFDPSVRWFVNDVEGGDSVLGTISGAGLYTAPSVPPSPATVVVRANSVADPSKNDTAEIIVIDIVSLEISPTDTLTRVGLAVQFTAMGLFSDDSFVDVTNRVQWSSSDSSVASIDQLGLASPSAPGVTNISARFHSAETEGTLSVAEFAVVVNPTDPLLLRIVTPSQDVVEYFGTRDAQGQVQTVDSLSVLRPDDGRGFVELETDGLPRRLTTPDGTVFEFVWQSETVVTVIGTSADGSEQVTLTVDLVKQEAQGLSALEAPRSEGSSLSTRTSDPLRQSCLESERRESLLARRDRSAGRVQTSGPTSNSRAVVRHCGDSVDDAIVYLEYVPEGGTSTTVIPGVPAGDGVYLFSVPVPSPSDPSQGEPICASAGTTTEGLCAAATSGVLDVVCLQLALTGIAAKIVPGCLLGSQILKTACPYVTVGPSGGPNLFEAFCNQIANFLDRPTGSSVVLRAQATIPGVGVFLSDPVPAPVSGPFPEFVFNVGEEVNIADFFTEPEDPAPLEGYVATAVIRCAPSGTLVQISIVGTDGYQDQTACTILGNGVCSLAVPGAEAGIVDTLTVTVGQLQRIITIVF